MYCPPAPLWPMATALSAAISMSPLATVSSATSDLSLEVAADWAARTSESCRRHGLRRCSNVQGNVMNAK
jgi:hypothetical protein